MRSSIEFLVRCGLNASEVWRQLVQAYGRRDAYSYGEVDMWVNHIRGGEGLADRRRSRLPGVLTRKKLDEIEVAVNIDRRVSVKLLSHLVGLSVGSTERGLRQLGYRKRSAHFVPHLLTAAQRQKHIDSARLIRNMIGRKFDNIVTGDETWIFSCDPESKLSSSQWLRPDEPRPQKVRKPSQDAVNTPLKSKKPAGTKQSLGF